MQDDGVGNQLEHKVHLIFWKGIPCTECGKKKKTNLMLQSKVQTHDIQKKKQTVIILL